MTEQEWHECKTPDRMLAFAEPRASARKLRLFACACARGALHLLSGELRHVAAACLDVGEDFADATVSADTMVAARSKLREMPGALEMAAAAAWSALTVPTPDGWENMAVVASHASIFAAAATDRTSGVESLANCHLLRDIIGPLLFRTFIFFAAWRTPSVTALANAIYTERRFADLPILADALEEAGCTSADVLGHLRSAGEHVRGCWALDLVLGKE